MVFNKKKAKEQAIDELQKLQSTLESLRAKQLNALEGQLQAIEKARDLQKEKVEKARQTAADAKQRLRDKQGAKPSLVKRAEESLSKASAALEAAQAELAQRQSDALNLKLQLRKEKAVAKAMSDADKAFKNVTTERPAKTPAPARSASDKPTTKQTTATPNKKAPVAAKPAGKKAPDKPAPTAKAAAPQKESAVAAPAPKPATPQKKASKPREDARRSKRPKPMSDIPSHPSKAEDRLASLFDDF